MDLEELKRKYEKVKDQPNLKLITPKQKDYIQNLFQQSKFMDKQVGATGEPRGAIGEPTGATGEPQGAIGEPTGAIGEPTGAIGEPTVGNVFPFISEILNHQINSWEELQPFEVSQLIKTIPKHIKLMSHQLIHLTKILDQNNYDLSFINQKLDTQYQDLSELSLYDYRRLTLFIIPDISGNIQKNKNIKTKDYPIISTQDWELGCQNKESKDLYYLRFYTFPMLDFDHTSLEELVQKLKKFLELYPKFFFKIYQTFNGFHVFIMSHQFHYMDPKIHRIMEYLGCDPWYIFFVRRHGYKVRLNPKANRPEEEKVSTFVQNLGNEENLDPSLDDFLTKVEFYENLYTNTP